MNDFQRAVHEFSFATGGPESIFTQSGRELRAKLIMEEAVETVAALGFAAYGAFHESSAPDPYGEEPIGSYHKMYDNLDLLDFIDGLCDLTYVTMGGAIAAGVDLQRHFEEVHRANMRKLDGPRRADGKVLKPKGWVGPDHRKVLEGFNPPDYAS